MSNKNDIQTMLVSMGFKPNYITRAFKVYEKNYGHSYNVEVITEIIVRLQNKDKAKAKNKSGDKDKSSQSKEKQQSPSKDNDKDNKNNKNNKDNKSKDNKKQQSQSSKSSNKSSSSKSSPNKSKSSQKDSPSKPKTIKKEKPSQPPQQVNIQANKRISGKINHSNNNNGMKTEPPPQPSYSNNNQYGNNSNNLPNMGGMARSQSGGKRKQKPMKPPPSNPLPKQNSHNSNNNNYNGSNNQGSPPKIHTKSQTVMSSSFKPARQSPVPPPRFNVKDIVIYNGQEAEVMRILNQNQIEITYPVSTYIMQRSRATVSPQQLQRKKVQPPPQSQQHQPQYGNNNSNNRPPPQGHQYSQSHAHYPSHQNGNNNNNNNKHRSTQPPISNANQVNISMNGGNNSNNSQQQQRSSNKTTQQTPTSNNNNNNHTTTTKTKDTETMPVFESHMPLQDAFKLKIHDKLDHRDQVGRFVYATVSEKQGTNLKIHYDGWSRKWDTWSDFQKEIHRFAKAGSISKRPAHRFKTLKKGDYVDINPTQRHPGWKCGEIRRLDQKSGQVQVVYESADKNYLYWAHLDHKEEIAEFTSKSGTVHATQVDILGKQQPQQYNNNNAKQMQQQPQQRQLQQGQYGGNPQQQQQYNQQHQGYNNQQQHQQHQQQMYQQQMMQQAEPMDEMEAFERIRAKRFPRYPNEKIENPYGIGDWLEVQDTQTHQWITATVIDKENNWIVVHFDGWPSKYDQKIHAVKHKKRLRALGSGLQETQEEKDIKEEMNNFLKEVEQLNWKLVEVDADGNCLYRCFATQIYNDTNKHMLVRNDCCKYMRSNLEFFQNFIPDFESRMKEKEQEYEWGDHVDITALSELYNVRVRVFEYDKNQKKLYMSFDQGEHEETVNLPLILLARHRKKHYNIINDPQAVHKRPLGTAQQRVIKAKKNGSNVVSLRDLRLKEDAQNQNEHKDDEKDIGDGDNGNADVQMIDNRSKSISRHNSYHSTSPHHTHSFGLLESREFDLTLNESDFNDVLETWNLSEPLQSTDLKNIFKPLLSKVKKKLDFQWENNHKQIDKQILNTFWKQRFEESQQSQANCKKWIKSLKEKIPNGQYNMKSSLTSFNQTIVSQISEGLGYIVATRKRESTIDIHRIHHQQYNARNNVHSPHSYPHQHAMDIDK